MIRSNIDQFRQAITSNCISVGLSSISFNFIQFQRKLERMISGYLNLPNSLKLFWSIHYNYSNQQLLNFQNAQSTSIIFSSSIQLPIQPRINKFINLPLQPTSEMKISKLPTRITMPHSTCFDRSCSIDERNNLKVHERISLRAPWSRGTGNIVLGRGVGLTRRGY